MSRRITHLGDQETRQTYLTLAVETHDWASRLASEFDSRRASRRHVTVQDVLRWAIEAGRSAVEANLAAAKIADAPTRT